MEIKRVVKEKDRMLLRMEYWVDFPAMATAIVLAVVVSYVEMPAWLKTALVVIFVGMIIAVAFVAVRISRRPDVMNVSIAATDMCLPTGK